MFNSTFRMSLLAAALTVPASLPAAATPFDAASTAVLGKLATSMDENNDGYVTPGEADTFAVYVGVSMDTNSDGLVEYQEFLDWDPGFQWLADKRGTGIAYRQMKGDLFKIWDADSDGRVTRNEILDVARFEFAVSDINGDSKIDADELASGSLSIVSLMNAV